MSDTKPGDFPLWRTPEGEPVSCVEKIKVLNENLAELRALAQEALEDAVLMGADERQVREVLGGSGASVVEPCGEWGCGRKVRAVRGGIGLGAGGGACGWGPRGVGG